MFHKTLFYTTKKEPQIIKFEALFSIINFINQPESVRIYPPLS